MDFLFLDYTNGSIYDPELKTLLEVAEDLKAKGVDVPRLVFFLNFRAGMEDRGAVPDLVQAGQIRRHVVPVAGQAADDGSPSRPTPSKLKDPALLPAIQDYFTWRPTWAFQDAAKEPTKWRFMDDFNDGGRQRPALGPDGKPEQIVVNKSTGRAALGQHADRRRQQRIPAMSPSYNDQWLSPDNAKGLFFQWHVG